MSQTISDPSAPKKRKRSFRYVEITNKAFLKWFTAFRKEKLYVQDFLLELDDQDNWTFRLKCTGNCRNKNEPFSVKETDCPNSIKTWNGNELNKTK